ncbi:thioesterase domain protein [Aspergillus clavatus NRRL 1]|uniref:Thioesterase domain protein n=1 Tax=Aspergillus clavatus (strain ATCC 1007 / CBS 513.65 / DSM 816 / NCTC 3887 / NRRL 1 / QM 1276 / 107) TaxID=344612 RepID=A1CLB9_ASPCL|nr:thioesterase domain protein [Aspergillus clavatus NRRL 1]EAW09943.1 thioesterase domain protein [Aspergillus clavatus NRRL 1]
MALNSPGALYPGEHLDTVAWFPALYKFSPADPSNPLIVFIPGGGHNARISYGGHPGSREKDFLAYWLNKQGYGFLAISYPLHSEPDEIIPATAPGYRIRDWGLQAAEITRLVISQHNLSGSVVLLAWSMGGRIVVPYTVAARARGLNVEFFVGLAATPGLPGVRPIPRNVRKTSQGYAALDGMPDLFLQQLHGQNELNSGVIIPDDVYLRSYYGHTPVSLLGCDLRYSQEHGFVEDRRTSVEDAAALDFHQWPLIAALHGDSVHDARHVLADRTTWAFVQTQHIVSTLETHGLAQLDRSRWGTAMDLIHSRPGRMCRQIHGTHFFFLGEQGARATAVAIVSLLEEARKFATSLSSLLGTELSVI